MKAHSTANPKNTYYYRNRDAILEKRRRRKAELLALKQRPKVPTPKPNPHYRLIMLQGYIHPHLYRVFMCLLPRKN